MSGWNFQNPSPEQKGREPKVVGLEQLSPPPPPPRVHKYFGGVGCNKWREMKVYAGSRKGGG